MVQVDIASFWSCDFFQEVQSSILGVVINFLIVKTSFLCSTEVFTLLHEFLRIPPDSQWKVGIPQNSMEFLWKAIGWSLQ